MAAQGLKFLEDKWDEKVASGLDTAELSRYRSNLLGSDLRITNFGGGNTSLKLELVLHGTPHPSRRRTRRGVPQMKFVNGPTK